MIDDVTILKAVRALLKHTWPDVDVNLDDVQRSFRLPCFFLRFYELDSPEMYYSKRLKRACTLHIDYFTQKSRNSAVELYKVRRQLKEIFMFGMKAGDRWLSFDGIQTETNGKDADILTATLTFSFFDSLYDVTEEEEKIGSVTSNMQITEKE